MASSRGDYPFITVTAGTGTGRFAKLATVSMLKVRREGQGKDGFRKPVLFPKIVFLYDENLHGPGKPLEDVFEEGVRCSAKTMYPDWLSLTGEGYVASMYKKYGKIVSPMAAAPSFPPGMSGAACILRMKRTNLCLWAVSISARFPSICHDPCQGKTGKQGFL